MILRKSWPVRGLKMKMAPLMGLVVRLPSKVLWMVTRYTLVSSTNQMICKHAQLYGCAAPHCLCSEVSSASWLRNLPFAGAY